MDRPLEPVPIRVGSVFLRAIPPCGATVPELPQPGRSNGNSHSLPNDHSDLIRATIQSLRADVGLPLARPFRAKLVLHPAARHRYENLYHRLVDQSDLRHLAGRCQPQP